MGEIGPNPTDLRRGEEGYEKDKNKAEVMAYAEKPYAVVVENAKKAAGAGVTGMESVYAKLAQQMDNAVAVASAEYDKTREKIEDLKLTIAQRISDFEVPKENLNDDEKQLRNKILRISHMSSGRGPDGQTEDDWIKKLPNQEQEEIMGVTYGLLGVPPIDQENIRYNGLGNAWDVKSHSESLGLDVKIYPLNKGEGLPILADIFVEKI
jgi:hypothetical protein